MHETLEAIGDFVFTSKYARYRPEDRRRETWEECVNRVEKMHLDHFAHLQPEVHQEIHKAFDLVREKRVVPSMRSLQFAGEAVDAHNARIFNCAVRQIDSPRAFAEVFYLLLCGCGVGLGVTKKYVSKLPYLVSAEDKTGTIVNYVVEDTIEGWSDSVEALLDCYLKNTPYSGRKIVFDYSRIRRKGTTLKTSGGKAPGYTGLKKCHQKIKRLLDSIIEERHQRALKPIDCYDVLMHTSDAVLSGGIRRSATIVIFDPDDKEMMEAKTGDWVKENPQRARSNNSALILRDKITLLDFKDIIAKTREYGEPGFVFADTEELLVNPCAEISFAPGEGVSQFCNLTSINGALVEGISDFHECVYAATVIGTLQAAYTQFKYLGHASKETTDEEALLGVSITGFMDNPDVLLNCQNLQDGARVARETNKVWAKILGINPAARITCVKPEGTSSLVLGSASGIHPHHARKYIRRVQINKEDNVYQFFRLFNKGACEPSVWSANKTDDVINFPIEVPQRALIKENLTTLEHLEIIKTVQCNWVIPGTTDVNRRKVNHNVSCTVLVDEDEAEWVKVAEYLYTNRQFFTAVSLLPRTGDKLYDQAPLEAIESPEDNEYFEELVKNWEKVPYDKLSESKDFTTVQQTSACSGGTCDL